MSFSTQVKDDITRVLTNKVCCRKAEFIAFFLINGNLRFGGGQGFSLLMSTEHPAAARKMFTLSREFVETRDIAVYRRTRLKKNSVYNLVIPNQPSLNDFLAAIGMVDSFGWKISFSSTVEQTFLRDVCCRRAYLRGAFLASGSVSDPGYSYHMEIANLDPSQAELIIKLMADFGLEAKQIERKGASLVYLKEAEQISDFLNVIGSHRSLLEMESVRITKEMRNKANRIYNCDMANLNKTMAAAQKQCEDIAYIDENLGLGKLPVSLREAADLRLNYTDFSLNELAEQSGIGRSALNHRFRRISQIADNIRSWGAEGWNHQ